MGWDPIDKDQTLFAGKYSLRAPLQAFEEIKQERHFCILSLDGGGVKAIIHATILARLERYLREQVTGFKGQAWLEELEQKSQYDKQLASCLPHIKREIRDLKLADFFDMMAGTSAGQV